MPPAPTPTTPAQSTTTSSGLDPQAVALTQAIRQTETGGNFQAKGASGEYGAYQWEPGTWEKMSSQAGVDVPLAQATPEQQNEVAYKQVKAWKDQGYNVGQIASMWNAGSGAPNAYLQNNVGVNSKGVSYNTPSYAKKVATYYQQYKTQGPAQPTAQQPGTQGPGGVLGAAEGIGNFLFPAVKDAYNDITGQNQKTALQQAGDVGLTALPFIPGLGEAGEAARGADAAVEGGGILAKLTGNTAAKGALAGYGSGVASNLSQGEGLGQSFMPNASTLGGAALGGAAGAIVPKLTGLLSRNLTEEGAVNATQADLRREVGRTVPGKNLLTNLPNGGTRALSLLSRVKGALPEVADGKFNPDEAITTMESRVGALSRARAAAIAKVAPKVNLDALASEAKARITQAAADSGDAEGAVASRRMFSGEAGKMAGKIDSIVQDIKDTTGKSELDANELELFKEAQADNSGVYRRTGAIGDQNASSLLADTARDTMENMAAGSGLKDLEGYNQYIKDHYDAIKVLQRLGRQTVKGGRLGKMLAGHTAAAVGAVAGNSIGPVGVLGGGVIGEGLGNIVMKIFGDNSLSNPARDAILNKIEQGDPKVVQELGNFIGREGSIAPQAIPKPSSKTGLLQSLLIKGGARIGASL